MHTNFNLYMCRASIIIIEMLVAQVCITGVKYLINKIRQKKGEIYSSKIQKMNTFFLLVQCYQYHQGDVEIIFLFNHFLSYVF